MPTLSIWNSVRMIVVNKNSSSGNTLVTDTLLLVAVRASLIEAVIILEGGNIDLSTHRICSAKYMFPF